MSKPKMIKLFPRHKDVRAHIDHVRDFFVMITNYGVESKDFKIQKLDDKILE